MERLHYYFEQRAEAYPDHIALICSDAVVSYEDLEHRANRWAHLLQQKGAKDGDIIGLLLHRSVDLYAVMLGILKVGAAYLPFDPEFPEDRIQYMLSDCEAKLLVTANEFTERTKNSSAKILFVDELKHELSEQPITRMNDESNQKDTDSLCYVIYTSGTTGRPKGVAITHHNVCNFLDGALKVYGVTANDRIYQGFSIAFDASIEEIWLALANGASLIVGASNALHAGASLSQFLNLHEVTVLSTVPTLLSMIDNDVKSLRLLILGGEVCPQELVKQWSKPNLRIINTYGPTETTIVSTYHECNSHAAISIGVPLPNYEIYILDDNLKQVPKGEVGELYIGGKGVAQGYIKRPELNEKKFIPNPNQPEQRLYRTGDLVYLTDTDELQFVGRADEQIKLRGYRIELSEIEAVINNNPAIRKSVVALKELTPGVDSLVAYLVLKEKEIDTKALNKQLHERLPEYMVPALYEIINDLPLLASGKVDRKNLPKPTLHQDQVNKNHVPPTTEFEKKVVAVWEKLFQHQPISLADDFFRDLGGHSLLAARVVSELRKYPETEYISMLDIYENPTITQLTKKFATISKEIKEKTQVETSSISNLRFRLCGFGQAIGSYFLFGIRAWEFLFIILSLTLVINKFSVFSIQFLELIGVFLLVLPPIIFAIPILAKWLLLGRVKPGQYRLWGWFYIRWWLVLRIQKAIFPADFLIGSPLMNMFCRLMGAKIGKNCHIGTVNVRTHDLLTLGDNTSIAYNANLSGYIVENGWLKIRPITLGKRCFVGTRSILNINTVLEDDAMLEDLSMLPANTRIPEGKCFRGSPARLEKNANICKRSEEHDDATVLQNVGYGFLHYLGLLFVTLVYYASFIPAIILIEYFYNQDRLLPDIFIAAPIGAFLFLLLFCTALIVIKKLVLGKMVPGSYKIKSFYYIRYWIIERLIDTRDLEVMADSLYFPFFLRLLGAKVGKRVEMAELPHLSPDLLTINDESFTASWALIGSPRVDRGYAYFAPIVIGKRAFVGNVALLPPGTVLGDGSLIGGLSIPPADGSAAKPGTSWFGSPAVFLPRREIFAGFSEKETYLPSKSSYLKRALIEFVRILLPSIFALISLIGIFLAIDYLYDKFSLLTTILLFPFFDMAIVLGLTLVGIGLKWLLVGKLKEGLKPVWSIFIWKYDILEHLYNEFISPMVLEPLLGTPFVAFFFRLLGTKIGKRVFLDSKEFAEFDLIDIGNDVALNAECIIQTHLYEDRIFKMGPIKINDNCNVGAETIVIYNSIMEKRSSLGSLSLLMKGEILPHDSHWAGIPAQYSAQQAADYVAVSSPHNDDLIGSAYIDNP